MELIEIAKNVEAANSAIEKLGLNQDNERKPFAITISVFSYHSVKLVNLRKDNSIFFYHYRHIWNALVWTFGDLGRAILENANFEAFEYEENISSFIAEIKENDERVRVYVDVRDMR